MDAIEIRDLDDARDFLAQGLWLQRVVAPAAATVRPALEQVLEIVAFGQPLISAGFVADLGNIVCELNRDLSPGRDLRGIVGLGAGLLRGYEDHVIGRLSGDWTLERAGHVLRRLQGRDRNRGLAFVLNQFRERSGAEGVVLSPAVVKSLLNAPAEEVLARGWEALAQRGVLPLLARLYESLIAACRGAAEALSTVDVFELEHGTALADLGQRVALRQVLHQARRFEDRLPAERIQHSAGRHEVPTRVLDEDTYPVGGYSAVSTRGSLESLLHSQLAFMEPAESQQRPDLFDVKYLRDELLFYSRDENQFLRRRRTFVVVLAPDLEHARFKDIDLPTQRIVLILALLVATVRRVVDCLSNDALHFEFLFVGPDENPPLLQEKEILAMVLRELIANGTVKLRMVPTTAAAAQVCGNAARGSLCHAVMVGAAPLSFEPDDTVAAQLTVANGRPALTIGGIAAGVGADDALGVWDLVFERLLRTWM